MRKIAIMAVLLFSLSGCISSAISDAVDSADQKVRLKWQEEWKPALLAEVKSTISDTKEAALKEMTVNLEKFRTETTGKLATIGVKVENFDTNGEGRISGAETLALVKEIKAKNDDAPTPLKWWEIIAALGAAYLPLTGAKEMAKSKMAGTGNGKAA